MITKTKRYGFIFSQEMDEKIKQLAKETGLKYSTIFEKAFEAYFQLHMKKKDEK